MTTKKKMIWVTSLCAAIILATPFIVTEATADVASYASVKTIDPGATWIVGDTTNLAVLRIAEGATIQAPEGHSVTLTVNGVETNIEPGFYRGKIVLSITEDIPVTANTFGFESSYHFRTAIDVEDGTFVKKKSVEAAVPNGTVTDTCAKDITITSYGENFNGIIVKGDSEFSYDIVNPTIHLTGNGENDFIGYAAAIMSSGNANVTVENARIINRGAARTAIWVGGNSTMHVNHSYIETHNGILPADYQFNVQPGTMWEVPWVMGIVGNLRATNLTENGTVYYNNTHIKTEGWGCLSTDAVTNTRLFATDCLIETVESGYGAFSLAGNVNTFSRCIFNVADIGMVSQNGDGVFTDQTVVNSGRFGVMYFGSGDRLIIKNGSVFNTESTVIQLKSPGHDIVVDNAELNPGNGILLQVMPMDDPFMVARNNASPEIPVGGPDGGAGMPSTGSAGDDVNALFKDVTLEGDIVNGDTASTDLNVTLNGATITGAITSSVVTHALGPNGEEVTLDHPELYYLVGEVTNTYCSSEGTYGVTVSLDGGSRWIVDKTSYMTALTIAEGASIEAPGGCNVIMIVDDVETAIGAGSYEGKIVLKIASSAS